jgi:hypothetical protein
VALGPCREHRIGLVERSAMLCVKRTVFVMIFAAR